MSYSGENKLQVLFKWLFLYQDTQRNAFWLVLCSEKPPKSMAPLGVLLWVFGFWGSEPLREHQQSSFAATLGRRLEVSSGTWPFYGTRSPKRHRLGRETRGWRVFLEAWSHFSAWLMEEKCFLVRPLVCQQKVATFWLLLPKTSKKAPNGWSYFLSG